MVDVLGFEANVCEQTCVAQIVLSLPVGLYSISNLVFVDVDAFVHYLLVSFGLNNNLVQV